MLLQGVSQGNFRISRMLQRRTVGFTRTKSYRNARKENLSFTCQPNGLFDEQWISLSNYHSSEGNRMNPYEPRETEDYEQTQTSLFDPVGLVCAIILVTGIGLAV